MPEMRTIDTGEVALRCAVEGEGPLVIMVHGFPESWYSWRHQIGPVADAGFTACAIDVRGYGGSDKPQPVEAYAMERIVGDLIGLRKALSPDAPAVLVGHDWGAPIVWNSALTHPEHFRAVAGMSVPFSGVLQKTVHRSLPRAFHQSGAVLLPGVFPGTGRGGSRGRGGPARFRPADDVFDQRRCAAGRLLGQTAGRDFLGGLPDPEPVAWLTEDDLDFYEAEFTASGFRGPLNRYRNHEADYEWLQNWAGKRIEQPALFIGGTRDPATFLFGAIEDPVALVKMFAPRAEGHILDGVGHWTQQERPDEVNAVLIDWLKRL